MNRANFGNIVTNGMQILSVAGTTAAKAFNKREALQRAKYDASSALNNMSLDEARQVGQMRAEQMKQQLKEFNEAQEFADVDEIMASAPLKTQEMQNISNKINNDISWSDFWYNRNKEFDITKEFKKKILNSEEKQ